MAETVLRSADIEYEPNSEIFYNPAETLSYNFKVNMVCSMRGGGKTFGTLVMLINRYKRYGEQFIYLRRTHEEIKECKDKLFDDIKEKGVFPDDELRCEGKTLLFNNEIMGGVQSLSKAYQVKSVAWPKVRWILFDEFIIEDTKISHYLPNEPMKLEGYMETIGRLRKLRVILLGNMATKANPYFDYYKMWPKANTKFQRNAKRGVLLHMWDSEAFRAMKKQTDMAKLIEGTAYGDYMLGNSPFMDNDTFIGKPDGFLDYVVTYKFNGLEMGQWYNRKEGVFYISSQSDPSTKKVFAFDTDSHGPNLIFIRQMRNHPNIKQLRWAFENGLLRFENLTIKNNMYDLLNVV